MIDMPGQCINIYAIYVVFTLDRRANMFRLRIPRLSVPEDSAEFSVNASHYRHWDNSIRAYIDDCIKGTDGPFHRDHNMQWTASFHRGRLPYCATPGETSRSPGTITAHSRFSRNSLDLICHCPKDDDFASPIWMMDQYRTNANAVASSGNGPDRIKWLFPCTRMPTI
jgi:hypothetical protein